MNYPVAYEFRNAYTNRNQNGALHALYSIAYDHRFGIDDLTIAKATFSKCFNTPKSPPQLVQHWTLLCSLLANVNFLETCAQAMHPQWKECLVVALGRACTAFHYFADVSVHDNNQAYFDVDAALLIVFATRMRVCARRLACANVEGIQDPIKLAATKLSYFVRVLNKQGRKLKEANKASVKAGLAVIQVEVWRLEPQTVSVVEMEPRNVEGLDDYANTCTISYAALVYYYAAFHLIHKGNLEVAEILLAKSYLCVRRWQQQQQYHGEEVVKAQKAVVSAWTAINLTRGYIPSTSIATDDTLVPFQGIILALQSGRVDTFDNAMKMYEGTFAQISGAVLLDLMCTRLVVIRNFIIKYTKTLEKPSQVYLQGFFEYAASGDTGAGGVFESLEHMRDSFLVPLVIRDYIRGRVDFSRAVLVMSGELPFPEIPLRGDKTMNDQPAEPKEEE